MIDGPLTVKRYQKLKSDRSNFDSRWESMAPFICPSRVGITGAYAQGDKQTRGVFDSTTMMATEMMAMFAAGHIINPSQQWIGWAMDHPSVIDNDATKEWLEECRDRYIKRLSNSQFYSEAPEALIDWGGFGTGWLIQEEAPQASNITKSGFRGFYFHAEKIGRYVISEGVDGLVDTTMREFGLTARLAAERWKSEDLPENIQNAIKEGQLDKPYKFIHAILPRDKAQQGYGNLGMPWASCWIELESKKVVHESGYRVFPVAVPRYQRTPGEVYGRGRGDLAFPDTWTLNTAKRMGLEDWALKIKPPVLGKSNSIIGTLRLVPAGYTPVNTGGGRIQDSFMPYETGSHPEVSHIKEEELRKSIREIFYVDVIREFMQVHKSEETAFEFSKKLGLLFKIFGPVYGRLEYEMLNTIADIGWDIMYHAGEFPPPPPEVFNSDGLITTVFQNPIAKAQRAEGVESITLAIGDLAPLTQVPAFAQMLDRLDPDKATSLIFDIRGVPAKVTRSDKEMVLFRKAREAQNAQQQQLDQVTQVAEGAGKVAPFIKALQGGQVGAAA